VTSRRLRDPELSVGSMTEASRRIRDPELSVGSRTEASRRLRDPELSVGSRTEASRRLRDPEHLSKYVTFLSCRQRKDVITETLIHSLTMEENLEKLKEAGDVIIISDLENVLDKNTDIKIDKNNLNLSIQKGKKLLQINESSLEDIFNRAIMENPNAKIIEIKKNVYVITSNGQIICPVYMVTNINDSGKPFSVFYLIAK